MEMNVKIESKSKDAFHEDAIIGTFEEVKKLIKDRKFVFVKHGERRKDGDLIWDVRWIRTRLFENSDWVKHYEGTSIGVLYEGFGGVPYHFVDEKGIWSRCKNHEHILMICQKLDSSMCSSFHRSGQNYKVLVDKKCSVCEKVLCDHHRCEFLGCSNIVCSDCGETMSKTKAVFFFCLQHKELYYDQIFSCQSFKEKEKSKGKEKEKDPVKKKLKL